MDPILVLIVAGIFAVAFVGDWLRSRLNSRPCPRCGHRIATGKTECDCGYSFDQTQGRNP